MDDAFYTRRGKRTFDFILAASGLVLLIPVLLVVIVLVKITSKGPVFYRQPRSGQNGCVFILNKFRSMRRDAEEGTGPVWAQQSDTRVTRVGALLRRTRLDELPQLLNVLLGHMSFIGPRPERPEFVHALQKEIPYYMKRLSMKPGITGWAQVSGYRGETETPEKMAKRVEHDIYYIDNWSLGLDIRILAKTVLAAVADKNAY